MASLAVNAVANAVYRAFNVVYPIIISAYFARLLHPEGIGRIAYVSTIASYFTIIAALGVSAYGTREVAGAGSRQRRSRVVSELLTLNACSSIVALLMYGALVATMYRNSENLALFVVFAMPILLNATNVDWYFQGCEEYRFIATRNIVVKVVVAVLLLACVRRSDQVVLYAALTAGASVLNSVWNCAHLFTREKLTLHGNRVLRHLRPQLYLAGLVILGQIYGRIDVTMIGLLRGDAETGIYANAQSIIGASTQLVTAVTAVLLPRIVVVLRSSDSASVSSLISRAVIVVLALAAPVSLGLVLVSENTLIVLFGEAFAGGASVLAILAPLIIVVGVGDLLCYQLLLAYRDERLFLPSRIIGVVANVGLNSILIAHWGIAGAALASLVTECAVNIYLLRFALRKAEVRVSGAYLLSLCLSLAGMGGAVVAVGALHLSALPQLILCILTGMLVYGATALLTRNEALWWVLDRVKRGRLRAS